MKKVFHDIGEVSIQKLSEEKINEAQELIYFIYQHENIWINYSRAEIKDELLASFKNLVYTPVFFTAILNGRMIGIASYMISHISSQMFELSFGAVHPSFQRKGIGQLLTHTRLKEIISRDMHAVIFTRARRPKLFEKFNFKTIYKTIDKTANNSNYDYMFCPAEEINFNQDDESSSL